MSLFAGRTRQGFTRPIAWLSAAAIVATLEVIAAPVASATTTSTLVYIADLNADGLFGLYASSASSTGEPLGPRKTLVPETSTTGVYEADVSPEGLVATKVYGTNSRATLQVMGIDGSLRHVVASQTFDSNTQTGIIIKGATWLRNGGLVFGALNTDNGFVGLVSVNGRGTPHRVALAGSSGLGDPTYDRTHARLAAVRETDTGSQLEILSSTHPVLNSASWLIYQPNFAASGDQIAWTQQIGRTASVVRVGTVDSAAVLTGVHNVTPGNGDENDAPSFSPDGNFVFFDKITATAPDQLYRVGTDGNGTTIIAPGVEKAFARLLGPDSTSPGSPTITGGARSSTRTSASLSWQVPAGTWRSVVTRQDLTAGTPAVAIYNGQGGSLVATGLVASHSYRFVVIARDGFGNGAGSAKNL
jgi:hypothetical protein